MVPGMIMLWYGAIGDIPSGWHLCDGAMGTPLLCGKFVRGAGGPFAVDALGGSQTHAHDFTGDGHFHDMYDGQTIADGVDYGVETSTESAVGTTDPASTLPTYHTLCYIMKL